MTDTSAAGSGRRSLLDSVMALGWRRSAVMLLLGFAAGLPILLVFSTLSAWLRLEGVSRTEIGFFAWAGMAYTFKFMWSPLVDRLPLPLLDRLLGRRRSWILLAQIIVIGAILLASSATPSTGLFVIALATVMIAFGSATQDIALDAWRIDVAEDEYQALLVAIYQWGYRFGMIAAGAGALVMADFGGFSFAYTVLAGLMLIGVAGVFLAPEPKRPDALGGGSEAIEGAVKGNPVGEAAAWLYSAVVAPFVDFIVRYRWIALLILTLIGAYRLNDFVLGFMAYPFYVDMGYTLSEIGAVSKVYGVFAMLGGAMLAGIAATRWGVYPVLMVGAIISAVSALAFTWLALVQPTGEITLVNGVAMTPWPQEKDPSILFLTLAITAENVAGGWAGTALIAYMSSLTNRAFSATQYALFSSFYALPGKLFGGFSGIMVDSLGYANFFTTTALIGAPAVLLVWIVMRWRAAREVAAHKPQIS
ncbi:MFS transporter [Glycocaulis albus]|uniref:MFS transporter n=1 Tax=Glycocaulis albus TaxID=1382801 RepID=A0ABQ1XKI7_9PROT|nr:MFS transporter [Glycocaulis albus]GGG96097.1 MFS transporter [Glycocaulis albus]